MKADVICHSIGTKQLHSGFKIEFAGSIILGYVKEGPYIVVGENRVRDAISGYGIHAKDFVFATDDDLTPSFHFG